MSIQVHNPRATQDTVTKQWTYVADLGLPDGGAGHLEETRSDVAHQGYRVVIATDVVPTQWSAPPTATPADVTAYIAAHPACTIADVLAYVASTAGPLTDVDVTRFLGGIAAIEQYAARIAAAGPAGDTTTTTTGPDLTT